MYGGWLPTRYDVLKDKTEAYFMWVFPIPGAKFDNSVQIFARATLNVDCI